jgi:hypothetical protein
LTISRELGRNRSDSGRYHITVKEATDGRLSLKAEEIPALVHPTSVGEIPRSAASKLMGRDQEDFDVEIRF